MPSDTFSTATVTDSAFVENVQGWSTETVVASEFASVNNSDGWSTKLLTRSAFSVVSNNMVTGRIKARTKRD